MRRGAPTRRPVASSQPASGSEGAQPPVEGARRAPREEHSAVAAWVRILAVHKRGLSILREHLEREMTLPRFDLLANLARADGQTLASLSRSMLVTAGNLTGLVDRAARDGAVERRADPADRRAWRVHLTAKGLRAFRDAERRHAARLKRIFAPFSATEVDTLVRLLDKLRAELREPEPKSVTQRARAVRTGVRHARKKV